MTTTPNPGPSSWATPPPSPPAAAAVASVSATIELTVTEQATVVLQVAVAGPPPSGERLSVTVDGSTVDVTTLRGEAGGRQHLLTAPPGRLVVRYTSPAPVRPVPAANVAGPLDQILALRPSRFCPSDRVPGLASSLVGRATGPAATMFAACDYLHEQVEYLAGVSGTTTDAIDTLLRGQGVCRDFAHVAATLGRALDIPTRVVSVYAPGLDPMDLHAVVEAAVDGRWYVWDGTRLAPRQSLVRIATGRDAADTAFVTVTSGVAELTTLEIVAVAEGDLPLDDHTRLVALA